MPVTPEASAHEFLLRMSAEDSSAIMWSTDGDLRVVACFGGGLETLGIGPAERSMVRQISRLFPAVGWDSPVIAAHRRALNGEYVSFEVELDGRHFRGHVAPERNAQMEIVGCVGFAQEVAGGQASKCASLAGEQHFRTLVALSPAGIYLTDARGDCTYVNQRWCEMAGIGLEEALGRGWVQGTAHRRRFALSNDWCSERAMISSCSARLRSQK